MASRDKDRFWTALGEIYALAGRARRKQLYFVLTLMLAAAVAELATIGAVLPFLTLLARPDSLELFPLASDLFELLGATDARGRLIAATALVAGLAVVTGCVRLLLVRYMQTFMYRLSHELSVDIQRRILTQPYSFHIGQNSSRVLAALDKVQALVLGVLLPLLQAAIAAFITAFILIALSLLEPLTTLAAAAAFTLIYLLVSLSTRPALARNSRILGKAWDERIKVVQENLGGIRDVILENSQTIRLQAFAAVDRRFSTVQANTAIISAAPRFAVEAAGMIFIAVMALVISNREGSLADALPVLGALALGAQRILPLLQQIYFGWTAVAGHRSVVTEVLDLLRLPATADASDPAAIEPLPLRHRISIVNASFAYPSRETLALDSVTAEVPRGWIVALVGRTGSGKSTLADLLMGLLEPSSGQIAVDGLRLTGKDRGRWQRSIAHVPQAIFLADASIAANIAFAPSPEQIDPERVAEAAGKAQVHDFIASLPDGYETRVGERGVQLSGGQRQRIGIARAIYRRSPVIVLDEATSALDEVTEAAVMESLHALSGEGRTIVLIAHRLSVAARCDRIIRLDDGRVAGIDDCVDGLGGRASR